MRAFARRLLGWLCHRGLRLLRWLGRNRALAALLDRLPLERLPLVGEIAGRNLPPAVEVRGFGGSMSVPTVLRIVVDGQDPGRTEPAALAPVATALFPGRPPFVFNVSFACGRGTWWHGRYADPHSVWFNVFAGYYQIDVDHALWQRPFGYRPAASGAFAVDLEEVTRLGKADWNYFSNYLYGVPLAAVASHDGVAVDGEVRGRVRLGRTFWDEVHLRNVEVASAYSAHGGRDLELHHHPFLQSLWRAAFGGPRTRRDFRESFIPTRMTADLVMSYRREGDRYSTLIFGGTANDLYATLPGAAPGANAAETARFLEAQRQAVHALVAAAYGERGFAEADDAPA